MDAPGQGRIATSAWFRPSLFFEDLYSVFQFVQKHAKTFGMR
jgi:hypothetical protein